MRYRVQTFPNPHALAFHLRRRISNEIWMTVSGYLSREEDAPEPIKKLVASLLKIRGVKDVSIKAYELTVHKADLFTWDKIQPRVMEVLKKHFSPKQAMIAI